MSHKFSVRSALTAFLCVLLSGCLATTGAPSANQADAVNPQTTDVPLDPRLTEGAQANFFSGSGWQSCAVAGGGTAALCLALGGKPAKCLAGAIAVCGVAMGANYYLELRRSQYSNATQRLQEMTKDVKADTEKVAMRSETMRNVIKDDKKRIDTLNKDIKSKNISTDEARKELASIDKNLEHMRKELKGMKEKSENYQKVLQAERGDSKVNSKDLKEVESQIKTLNMQVAKLEQEINSAYSQRSAITLG